MSIRRLRKELDQLSTFGTSDLKSIAPKGDNLFEWTAKVYGPENSPYEGGLFTLDLTFPENYPFQAPKLKFRTCVYHPSVSKATGMLCSEVIEDGWRPNRDVAWVLRTVAEVLGAPSSTSPLEPDIARQLERYPNEFRKIAEQWTKLYADRDH